MKKRIFVLLAFLGIFGAHCVPQDTFWSDRNVAGRMKSSLLEKGYSGFSALDLVWILHQEHPVVAVPAAYLLGQVVREKEFAEKELVKELELWRDPLLARYIGGALNNLGNQSWTKIAVERLESLDASDSVNIAVEMARAKDYRGWVYVKKVMLDPDTSDLKFREAVIVCRLFEMMDTGQGRRHSLAAELEEIRVCFLSSAVSQSKRASITSRETGGSGTPIRIDSQPFPGKTERGEPVKQRRCCVSETNDGADGRGGVIRGFRGQEAVKELLPAELW